MEAGEDGNGTVMVTCQKRKIYCNIENLEGIK